jgi:predicted acyltransferase
MPFNKQLYSTSFAVVVIGISGICLSFFYVIIDILPQRYSRMRNIIKYATAPLLWTGVNPLFVYVLMQTV